MTLELNSLPTISALLLEYVPSFSVFAEHQREIDRVATVTNRNINECPVWDGGPLWVIMGVSIWEEIARDKTKMLVAGMEGGLTA